MRLLLKVNNCNIRMKLVMAFWHLSFQLQPIPSPSDTLLKKWSFPLRMSSVNVTKSAGNCD